MALCENNPDMFEQVRVLYGGAVVWSHVCVLCA